MTSLSSCDEVLVELGWFLFLFLLGFLRAELEVRLTTASPSLSLSAVRSMVTAAPLLLSSPTVSMSEDEEWITIGLVGSCILSTLRK